MTDEFQPYELKLPTVNNRVLLESVEKHLELHHPPLMLLTVHNLPATARPADRTLAVEFSQGQRLDTVAQILPGNEATANTKCICLSTSCRLTVVVSLT